MKEECNSALQPIFVIAAVWSLGCWLLIWIRLFQSFVDDPTNNDPRAKFGNRRDVLAVRLKQFLDGRARPVIDLPPLSSRSPHESSWVLEQLINPKVTERVQRLLLSDIQYPQLILEAYLEPELRTDDDGFLQLRSHGPDNLTHVAYPYKKNDNQILGACFGNGAQWILPTFHPPSMDHYFEGNVFRKSPMFDKRWELASGLDNDDNIQISNSSISRGYCPVDADPFLPWIHDVFPSQDGKRVELIISNKRRCNTDPKVFQPDLKNLEPQVALVSTSML
jgi:hypothetical protein